MVPALDDTIGWRWGRRIKARGVDRDPVRSSDSLLRHVQDEVVKASRVAVDEPDAAGADPLGRTDPITTAPRQHVHLPQWWLGPVSTGVNVRSRFTIHVGYVAPTHLVIAARTGRS